MNTVRLFLLKYLILILFLLLFLGHQQPVFAGYSCTVSISPSSVQANTSTNFSFSITNTGTGVVNYIKIVAPSSNFALHNFGVTGWSVSSNNSLAELSGGSVNPGDTFTFPFNASTGSTQASSANWQVSTNTGGGEVSCTGSLGTAISGAADIVSPSISDLSIIDITSSSAKINWTTNEAATSDIAYGTTDSFGLTNNSTTLTASHSVTLSGLSTNTTYYYQICSSDASGNQGCTDNNLFTTASTTSAGTATTQTVTQTVTKTETKTTTKIVEIKDTTPPLVSITTDFEKPFEQPPEITGRASDKSRIATVEYSIDGGENWLPVDEILTPGQISTEFRFIPAIFDDGNYEIKVRAIDGAGNTGLSKTQTLIIDRLPPLIGASLFTLGPLVLQPGGNGAIITSTGVEQKVTLSAAGGPISIDLFVNGSKYQLFKSVETGLWSGKIKFNSPGIYQIKYKAVDGGGNKTEGNLNNFIVVEPGQVVDRKTGAPIKSAKVSLFQKDIQTGEWYRWDGVPFNQTSPQITNDKGIYNYFLPQGQYYFKVEVPGYNGVLSQIFDISSPTPINTIFSLKPKIFPWQLNWEKVNVSINIPEVMTENNLSNLIGKITPEFNQLWGKPALITFLNSWSPPSIDQITILDNLFKKENKRINFQAVAVQEKSSKIEVFAKRGGYEMPFLSDPDGTLAQRFSAINLPTHVFLDRKGTVTKIISGVFTEEEILNNF